MQHFPTSYVIYTKVKSFNSKFSQKHAAMKKIILIFLMALLMAPAFAYDYDDPISETFRMTINSIKDDEFEFDEYGVWLINPEIIVTLHLNPDSIVYCYEQVWDGYSVFPSVTALDKYTFIENYGDSVKLSLGKGIYDCDDVFWLYIQYGSPDDVEGQRWLKSERFRVIDYIKNEDCLKAYDTAMSVETPAPVAENKNEYYDLSGRRLAAPPSKGIYIHNGKKIVVGR